MPKTKEAKAKKIAVKALRYLLLQVWKGASGPVLILNCPKRPTGRRTPFTIEHN